MFETSREKIHIGVTSIDNINLDKNVHVFAICITSDEVPVIGVRRTSFMYQYVMSKRKSYTEILAVDINHLKYMYNNEIKEICIRSTTPFTLTGLANFEELVLLGGRLKNKETIYQCLNRELSEESDDTITVREFGEKILKITIEDKILSKTFDGYCIYCLIDQEYSTIKKTLYNIEIKALTSLLENTNNEKYAYLNFIYRSLRPCGYGRVLQE